MRRSSFAFLLGGSLLAGFVGLANSATAETVTLTGCTEGHPPFCTIMRKDWMTYSFVGAKPEIPLGVGVTVVGTKTNEVTLCMDTTIKVIKWSRNKMKCPK